MTEPTPVADPATVVAPPAPEAPPAPQGDPAPQDPPLGPNGEKALASERALRATAERDKAALQAQLDKIAEANLSELEKAQKAAQDASEAAATARTEALRYRLAAAYGIDTKPGENEEPSDADTFLTGADEASMTIQAQRYAARLAGVTPPAPRTPAPDPSQGPRPGSAPSEDAEFAAYAERMNLKLPANRN
jgi:hypothetical protein